MDLTLLVTLYQPTKNEVEYWNDIYEKIEGLGVKINFLIDNPDFKISNFKNIPKNLFFSNARNLGKFRTVYNHIKSGKVNTKYFKVVDPDDYISLTELKKLQLSSEGRFIYKMNVVREEKISGILQKDVEYIVRSFRKKEPIKLDNFGNSYTILPTLMIFKDKYYKDFNIKTSDDQYLGFLAYVNGAKILSIDNSFYLYNKFNGYTGIENFKLKLINSFYTWSLIQELSILTGIKYPYNFKKTQLLNYKEMLERYKLLNPGEDRDMMDVMLKFENFMI